MSRLNVLLTVLAASLGVFFVVLGMSGVGREAKVKAKATPVAVAPAETICVTNLAPKFWSDADIINDIPAWEHALNVDFARYWHTAHYDIRFMGRKPAPKGCISAVVQKTGPVQGALAYHWTERNNLPSITVYAGVGAFYGYSNSVSMTHELQEMAADPVTSYLNIGYPAGYYWLEQKNATLQYGFNNAIGWFSEVSDPVEADAYELPGADGTAVKISDFVTPAWFNDGVGGRFDFMGLCQQPFWIRPGGYAQFLDASGWHQVLNFRKHRPADRGFFLMDPRGGASR